MTEYALETARRTLARTPAHKLPALIARCREIVALPVCSADERYEAMAIMHVAA